jgi:hypothetical protein
MVERPPVSRNRVARHGATPPIARKLAPCTTAYWHANFVPPVVAGNTPRGRTAWGATTASVHWLAWLCSTTAQGGHAAVQVAYAKHVREVQRAWVDAVAARQRWRHANEVWEATRTGSIDVGDDNSEEHNGSTRLDLASLRQAAEQEQADASDPQQSVLPELMACLDEQEHRIIRNCYLRRPPLSAFQLRKAMGGMEREQLEQLEQQALEKLRQAAEKQRHEFNA